MDDSDVVHCREVDKGGVISRPIVRKLSTEQALDKDFTVEDKDGIGVHTSPSILWVPITNRKGCSPLSRH